MKPISARITKGLQVGSFIRCADNSGATKLQIIAVKGYKGVKKRIPGCGVGSWVICSVKQGDPKLKHQVVHAVIVRQRKEYRRSDGTRVKFEDNSAVVLKDEKGNPKGTFIKGVVAKEACERWPAIAKLARNVA